MSKWKAFRKNREKGESQKFKDKKEKPLNWNGETKKNARQPKV